MSDLNFSVVIPLFNKEKSIESTVKSVLQQSYSDFELIIVNDGSTDKGIEIVESISDKRIKIVNKANGGVSSARNLGIRVSKNNYIALLDGDDLWMRNHLETLSSMISIFPDEVLYFTRYTHSQEMIFDIDLHETIRVNNYSRFVLQNNILAWSSCVCINKEKLNDQFFNENLTHGEDIEFWLRLSHNSSFIFNSNITAVYRLNTENRSNMNESFLNKKHFFYNLDLTDTTDTEHLSYLKHIYVNSALSFVFSCRFFSLAKYLSHYHFKFLSEICICGLKKMAKKFSKYFH